MSPYAQLKSPFTTSVSEPNLDWKTEYLDQDGVLRRSSSVTRRMIQRGVWIKKAMDVAPDEQVHTSIKARILEKQNSRRATMQLGEEAERKRSANGSLKNRSKFDKEKWLEEANLRAAEWVERQHEQYQQTNILELEDLVDLTEDNTAMSPSRSNTYIDKEGNLRRRISASPEDPQIVQDGFVPAPATPPLPAPAAVNEPEQYC
ncbi:unnamed protein product [Phytophthora fragariaefolia]|uniref:Unnamed protein product n=1 Tax=Phytophthora fragariaefolia TaxID=1490495 RepID=A0A9W7CW91_9STRA|nr:unnamed protein product [Phytophthora fragariaefolia]